MAHAVEVATASGYVKSQSQREQYSRKGRRTRVLHALPVLLYLASYQPLWLGRIQHENNQELYYHTRSLLGKDGSQRNCLAESDVHTRNNSASVT
jgi:hypothetical protein